MVYDGTASSFNDMVWIPSFGLPTVQSLLRANTPSTWMVDLDTSEQFLNFCLHPEAIQYVGIDLSPVFEDEQKISSKMYFGKVTQDVPWV